MTPQNQIKALAELDGWTYSGFTWTSPNGSRYADRVKRLTSHSPLELIPLDQILPAYLTSYDAIIPLVQKEFVKQKDNKRFFEDFYDFLTDQGRASWLDIYGHVGFVVLPPAQLCEALLRVTGRWRE